MTTQIYDFNSELNNTGGTFSVSTVTPGPGLGANVTVLGMPAVATATGQIFSNAKNAYTTEGIFGNLALHKPLGLLWGSNATFNPLLPNTDLQIPGSQFWQTMSGAALAIADQAGVSLQWTVNDVIYDNSIQEAGMTAIEAISNLASRVGGVLRWAGNNAYRVTYPDIPYGSWSVPDSRLINSSGIQYQNLYDLELFGNYGVKVLIMPSLPQYDAGTVTLFNPSASGGNFPPTGSPSGINDITVTQIGKTTKLLTSEDPAIVYDLPQDYYQVFIQILVPAGDLTGAFVTDDPTQWFSYDPGLAGAPLGKNYIFNTFLGGRYLPQVAIDSFIFPQNSSVQNGHFTLSLACSRLNLFQGSNANGSVEQQAQDASNAQIQQVMTQYEYSFRFVKVYTGKINCIFFGTAPLPGMWVSAELNGTTVQGIAESVSITPYSISIDVSQYKRLEFIQVLQNINSSNITGPS